VENVPSHLRVRFLGSRISATHLPQLLCLTPLYLNLPLSGPPLPLHFLLLPLLLLLLFVSLVVVVVGVVAVVLLSMFLSLDDIVVAVVAVGSWGG
jgi:hypothetical protein